MYVFNVVIAFVIKWYVWRAPMKATKRQNAMTDKLAFTNHQPPTTAFNLM